MADSRAPFIAHTHREWFDFLSRHAQGERLDEVNFWFPQARRPPRRFSPGDPIFFRLGAPERKIGGYGFFASFQLLPLDLAWETFGYRNGAPDRSSFFAMLGRFSEEDRAAPVACMLLLDAHFWPERLWLPWRASRGYADTGVQMGRTEDNPDNVRQLLAAIERDNVRPPAELVDEFRLLDVDERQRVAAMQTVREGQGAFRLRLLEAYQGACAITGEHTEPVLDAAHIQSYLGPRSNHPRNGIVMTKEFHTLFDRGLVTIEPPSSGQPDYRIRVSRLIRERWNNGKRYNEFDGAPLRSVPANPRLQPSPDALAWHGAHVFERTG